MLPLDLNLTYILGAALLSIPGYLTWWSSRRAALTAATKVEEVKSNLQVSSAAISHEVNKIHVAVNSERAAMLQKIEQLHGVILELSKTAAAAAAVPSIEQEKKS